MQALALTLLAGVALILAYVTYGRWLARLFTLREDSTTPAVLLRDGRDFIPTAKSIVFGHHFTSIAGTGPIVGPAIAVMWGWLPALLWVVFGSIFLGAVHDLGALVVSLRNKGRSIGDIAGDLLGPRVRYIFLGTLIIGLWIVLAVFGLVIAAVLKQYPGAILPFLFQIPLAVLIGVVVHRRGKSIVAPSIAALLLMYASVFLGDVGGLHSVNAWLAAQPTWAWTVGLLAYAYVASVLPVWVLLQPRDYINALQLLTALGLLVGGIVVAGLFGGSVEAITGEDGEVVRAVERAPLEIVAPTVDWNPPGAPPLIPILFITVACGAISGFHCLVGSGTTSKQLSCETHARAVGYGSMLTEGFLATLVIIACAAGLGLGTVVSAPASFYAGGAERIGDTTMKTHMLNVGVEAAYQDRHGVLVVSRIFVDDLENQQVDPLEIASRNNAEATVTTFVSSQSSSMSTNELIRSVRTQYHENARHKSWTAMQSPTTHLDEVELYPVDSSIIEIYYSNRSPALLLRSDLAFAATYSSWSAAGSLSSMVGAFVDGAANLVASLGMPKHAAIALMGVLVASFAGTTMDTACRLQRYVIQELAGGLLPRATGPACAACGYDLRGAGATARTCPECGETERFIPEGERAVIASKASPFNPARWLSTVHGATLLAVVSALLLAGMPAPGQPWSLATAGTGGLMLWPLFGATNQLLAGLAFVVIVAWLRATKRPAWFALPPMALMLVIPAWAMAWQAFIGNGSTPSWLAQDKWVLVSVASLALLLEVWLVVEAAMLWRGPRGPARS
ncbi:MAG: carbon starvation CstA family protein [Phycisphaerales bacterium]